METEQWIIFGILGMCLVVVLALLILSYSQLGDVKQCELNNCGEHLNINYSNCMAQCIDDNAVWGIKLLDKTKYLVRGN